MAKSNTLTKKDLIDVTAAILAGGLGTRLHSIFPGRPKVLAKVQGRPFLAYLLDQLVDAGLTYVVLCTGYLGEQVKAEFGDSYNTLYLSYSQEYSPMGTGGALRLALPLFKSDSILVMNGDSFFDADLRTFWAWHCARGAEASLLLTRVRDTRQYGRVHVDYDGRVINFNEKGDYEGSGWISVGIYLSEQRLISTIPEKRSVSLEKEMFPAWIGRGLYGYQINGRFLDIGTPEAYAAAEQFFTRETAG